ncbi:MAG: transporter [Nocardioides sp.]|nr:transporter [Nocardioides sp.]
MSTLLYRLGHRAFDRPWFVLAGWLVAIGIVIAGIALNGVSVSSGFKVDGTEAQTVLDRVTAELPEVSGGQASVVFVVPEGQRIDTPDRVEALARAIDAVFGLDQVAAPPEMERDAAGDPSRAPEGAQPFGPLIYDGAPVPGALLSARGDTVLFQFQFKVPTTSLANSDVTAVLDAVERSETGTGITALPSDSLKALEVPVGAGEVIGLTVAGIVLVLTLGSVVAAGLPLVNALVGVGIGVGGAYALSTVLSMSSATPVLGLMVGLAVGIDYSLFIVNRQRRLILDQGLAAHEAASRAVGTAGSAVFFAGLTVIVALTALTIIGITMLTVMALVAASTVALAVLIALTMLPALLGLVGERICSVKARHTRRERLADEAHSVADHWVKRVIKYRWPVIAIVATLLGVAAIPAASMELGIPTAATASSDSSARQGYDAISRGFGEGFNGPLLVTAEPTHPGPPITPAVTAKLIQALQQQHNVAAVVPLGAGRSGQLVVLSVIPKSGPSDQATTDLVRALRQPDLDLAKDNQVTLGVTGYTAISIDMSDKLAGVIPQYLGVIVLLSLLILMLVFRSVIVPLVATAGFLLSILATFGVTTAVFTWGWFGSLFAVEGGGPIMSFIPIIATGILYGLAMDYQVFLVSSMRDAYVHGHHGMRSVVHGFDQASRVVVAAALIMIAVFSGFIFSHDIVVKQVGLALAVGILIDAFFVRVTLMPAVMAIVDDRAWWLPRWLDRLIPNLDVEGDRLATLLSQRSSAQATVNDELSALSGNGSTASIQEPGRPQR